MATSNLLIVGDSFVAEGDYKYDWAWWNRLAKDLDCNTINLGITGASNFNIWHQLKEGLELKPDKVLVVLTAPNRIESYEKGDPSQEINYQSFVTQDFHSWAAHDRLSQKEFDLETFNKFFNPAINLSKDKIIVDAIVNMCKDYKSVILPNLFGEQMDSNSPEVLYSVIPRDYCDVVTGQLDEPEQGHIHESFHKKFYEDCGHRIRSLLQK